MLKRPQRVTRSRWGRFWLHTSMMADLNIRNVFLPPTALKLMRQSGVKDPGVKLRSIFTGGESLGAELLDWAGSYALCQEARLPLKNWVV